MVWGLGMLLQVGEVIIRRKGGNSQDKRHWKKGIIPESRNMASNSITIYIQKNMTISFLPTAVYLLRMWRIMIMVITIATMWTKQVAGGGRKSVTRSNTKHKTDIQG